MKKYLLSICLAAIASSFAHGQSLSGTISKIPEQVYRRAALAVVKISTSEQQNLGTGIIIGKSRNGTPIILTTNELITGFEEQLHVQLENQTSAVPAQIITPKWRNRDLVLLAARTGLSGVPAMPYGSADRLTAGDEVAVLGFPQTSFLSQNSGKVANTSAGKLTLNFAISTGQNGGPVIDQHGRVVGIAVSRGTETGEVVPIELVCFVVEDWLRNAALAEFWQEARAKKHWYGWMLGVVLISAAGVAIGVSGVL